MADKIHLVVVTPERAVLSEQVDDVVLPGTLGQMNILPGHLPLLTTLSVGEMVINQGGRHRSFLIDQGYAEILTDRIIVLTEKCEGVSEIDVEQARTALESLEKELSKLETLSQTEEVGEDLFELHRSALHRERMKLAFVEESGSSDKKN